MSFRRGQIDEPRHMRNYHAFMQRQVNAGENLGTLRAKASPRAQEAFLKAERVFYEMPDRVSRNLLKQLLRRSLKRFNQAYKQAWASHPVKYRSRYLSSQRKAGKQVLTANGDTRGLKTKAGVGFLYKRNPRSYVAAIVNSGRSANWRVKEAMRNKFPQELLLEDLATVIETQFVELAAKKGLKVRL